MIMLKLRLYTYLTIAIVLTLRQLQKTHDEIGRHLNLARTIVISIFHRADRQQTAPQLQKNMSVGQLS